MKLFSIISLGAIFCLAGCSEKENNNKVVVEIAQYKLIDGVSDTAFLQDSKNAQVNFLDKQPGYIKRHLLKNKNNEWTEIVYWKNMVDAKNAEKEVGKNVPMFQKMDPKTLKISFTEQLQSFE